MNDPDPSEKRSHPRFIVTVRVDVRIRILGSMLAHLFRTVNISSGGLLVASVTDDPRLEVNSLWETTLFLPRRDGGADKITCSASAVRKTADGHYGLKIVGIDSASQNTLNGFLERVAREGPDVGP